MRLHVGQRVLNFVLERKLGEGGFGEVWLAKAGMAATALKFVSVAGEDLERGRKEYNRVRLMIENGAFNHDRLIKLHGAWLLNEKGEDIPDAVLESALGGRTMELPDSTVEPDALLIQMDLGQESLASMLKRARKGVSEDTIKGLPKEDLLLYMRQAAEGIDFLNTPRTGFDGQARGAVYHCDIKPENLLLADGKVRICDYGVARIEGQRKTRSPNALSLAHASPELIDDQPCGQSDQYSLAISYVQLRTGRLPFKPDVLGGTWRTVMRAVARGDLELGMLEPRERAVIKRATSLTPSKRYKTATDMARALSQAVTGQTSIPGEDDPAGASKSRGFPWMKALVGLAATGLIAGGIWYWPQLPPPITSTGDAKVILARDAWHAKAHDDVQDASADLALFTALETAIKQADAEFEPADLNDLGAVLDRLMDGVMSELDQVALDDVKVKNIGSRIALARQYLSHEAFDAQRSESLLNRARLAQARLELHRQWSSLENAPAEPLVLFIGDNKSLDSGEPSTAGLVERDAANLLALRALAQWPGRDQKLDAGKIEQLVPVLEAVPSSADNGPSAAEQQRFQVLMKKAESSVTALLASNLDSLPKNLQPRIEKLFRTDYFRLGLQGALTAYTAGEVESSKTQLSALRAFAKTDDDQRDFAWYEAITKLDGDSSADAFSHLTKNLAAVGPSEQEMLFTVLRKRLVRATIASQDLTKLDLAIELCATADQAKIPTARRVYSMLLAQRMATRLLLPESDTNAWAAWQADVESSKLLLEAEHAFLEQDNDWIGFPLVELCQVELAANATSPDAAELTRRRDSVGSLNAAAQSQLEQQVPGYLGYVQALLGVADDGQATPAARLFELYSEAGGSASTAARIPGLTWTNRQAQAAAILVAAARELRSKEDRDLSVLPFTKEQAAAAVTYLESASRLGERDAKSDARSLAALASYYGSDENDPKFVSTLEATLRDDPNRAGPDATALLLVSAKLQAADGGDNKLAARRFAEALSRFDEWSKTNELNADRLKAAYKHVHAGAVAAADKLFAAASGAPESDLRSPLAGIYRSAALLLARLLDSADQEQSRKITAQCFERANDLGPDDETLKAEARWLKKWHSGKLDEDFARLTILTNRLPADDAEVQAIKGYILCLGYVYQSDPRQQRDDLRQGIEHYDAAIHTFGASGGQDARLFVERGDAYLQLAFVAHRNRGELSESDASIYDYLTKAKQDADAAIAANPPLKTRIEALNLFGNASEDIAYYAVDSTPDAWRGHYERAIARFREACDEDSSSAISPFNLARCRFRKSVDERRFAPAGATVNNDELTKAVNAVKNALTNWGEAESFKKAEAYYWLSEFQENLNDLAAADESRAKAVDLADRLGDPNWQTYQLQWAMLGLQRFQAFTAPSPAATAMQVETQKRATRLLTELEAPSDTSASTKAKRVDLTTAASASGVNIQLEANVEKAIQTVEGQLRSNSFAGDDPVNRACRAQLRLALAAKIRGLRAGNAPLYATLKPKAEAFANEVLTLTESEAGFGLQSRYRASAHWIQGEIDFADFDLEKSEEENVSLLNQAREHYRRGVDAIGSVAPSEVLRISAQLNNVVGYAFASAKLKKYVSPTQWSEIAKSADGYLVAMRPRIAAMLPTQVVNGKPSATWIGDIDKTRTVFQVTPKSP